MSKEKKFTPGPWAYDGTVIRCSDNQVWFNENRTMDEIDGNAQLVAAAPELLESLEWAIENLTVEALDIGRIKHQKCLSAIQKAYGPIVPA